MAVDTIVYEKKPGQTRIAGLKGGDLREIEILDANKAGEGNIYLGRITNKIDLANGKIGFFVMRRTDGFRPQAQTGRSRGQTQGSASDANVVLTMRSSSE